MPLAFRVPDAFERLQKPVLRRFHVKRDGAQAGKQVAHVRGFAFAHQPGIHVNTIHPLRRQRAQAERVGHRGIHAAAHEKEDAAIACGLSDLGFDGTDAVFGIPVAFAAADSENKVREDAGAVLGMRHFRMKLDRQQRLLPVSHRGHGAGVRGGDYVEAGRDGLHAIPMAHPDFAQVQPGEKRMRQDGAQNRHAVFAFFSFADLAA